MDLRYTREQVKWDIVLGNACEGDCQFFKGVNAKLKTVGNDGPERVVIELNPIIRGWMNYYKIDGISHMKVPFRKLQDYMRDRISRYYNRKSQRRSRLHGQQAFDKLVGIGLINPYTSSGMRPVNT